MCNAACPLWCWERPDPLGDPAGRGRYREQERRFFYVTPTSYLQLLESFKQLLTRKQSEVTTAQSRYEIGLSKLASTEQQVSGMQEELEALKPRLIVSSQETEKLLLVIQSETAEADKVKKVVQVRGRYQRDGAGAAVEQRRPSE